jgi:hypothetical protein
LVVTFAGPFCFWLEGDATKIDSIKVMAPPVGPYYPGARHQPWFGTSANEKLVLSQQDYTLVIDGHKPPSTFPTPSGTSIFYYEQGPGNGVAPLAPLFNLRAPIPDIIVGVVPTVVKMVCTPGTPDSYCKEWTVYATNLTFVYQNVPDLKGVNILLGQGTSQYFSPCFDNDQMLPSAGLGIHLSPLERLDPGHKQATKTWSQMLAMYPWMDKEITGIDFCPQFDASACPVDPKSCHDEKNARQHGKVAAVGVGPGNDCQVCTMMLPPVGFKSKLKKPL